MGRKKLIQAADLFCGAGGTSTGLIEAVRERGFDLKLLAINHWNIAIDTHKANHPDVKHLCTSLDNVNPRDVVPGGRLNILVASPECIYHSNARGGKPVKDQSRASAWLVLRWCESLHIDNVLIENVPEFRNWGPLIRKHVYRFDKEKGEKVGRYEWHPDPKRKGEIFQAFLAALRAIGYRVDYRVVNAANHGDPTTRERLFIIARRGRKPIPWPEPTHAPVAKRTLFGSKEAWKPARDIIDWSIPSKSIFSRSRPLAPNTIKRILAGLRKFGGLDFIVPQLSGGIVRSVDQDPLPTITTTSRGIGLCQPFLLVFRNGQDAKSLDLPLPSMTTKGANFGLIEPFLVVLRNHADARSVNEPLPALTADGQHMALCEPFIVHSGGPKANPRSVDEPLRTLLSREHQALVQPFIVQTDHTGNGAPGGIRGIDEPLGSLVTKANRALIEPFIIPFFGERDGQAPRTHSVHKPLPAITSHGAGGLVESFIMPVNHGDDERTYPLNKPMPTITSFDAWAVIEPFLLKYNGTGGARSSKDPLDTITVKDRFALVQGYLRDLGIEADGFALLDIRFRMLQPHELAAAMSFPKTYVFHGNREDKVKQIGNAVAVNTAKALCLSLLSAAA